MILDTNTGPGASIAVLGSSGGAVATVADELDRLEREAGVGGTVVFTPAASGASELALELAARAIASPGAREPLVIGATRASAGVLRDRLTSRGVAGWAGRGPRTLASYAFEVVGGADVAAGRPRRRQISGRDEDRWLAELLAADRPAESEPWGEWAPMAVRSTRAFRDQLRQFRGYLGTVGLDVAGLVRLGGETGRVHWVVLGQVLQQWDRELPDRAVDGLDSAGFLTEAARLIASGEVRAPELVIVDDAHELTAPGVALVAALRDAGARTVLLGDPDRSVGSFRGAHPAGMAELAARPDLAVARLAGVHRGPRLVRADRELAARIGVSGEARHRDAVALSVDGAMSGVVAYTLPSAAAEAAAIARLLRQRHALDRVSWHEMAVIVRDSARAGVLASHLRRNEVPVSAQARRDDWRHDAAAAQLILALRASVAESVEHLVPLVNDLVAGPILGLDPLVAQRLLDQATLRAASHRVTGVQDHAGPPPQPSVAEALLAGEIAIDDRWPTARAVNRWGRAIASARESVAHSASVETVLWELWNITGAATRWSAQAADSGAAARQANDHLDAVVALFDAAKRFAEQLPGAGVEDFLENLDTTDVLGDSLAAAATVTGVTVTTSVGALGHRFDTVVIAGVQAGVWPNLAPRGSLFEQHAIAEAMFGTVADTTDARRAVLFDELRLFLSALGRADTLCVVTAVDSEQDRPSPILALIPGDARPEAAPDALASRPLSLTALVADARRALARTARHEHLDAPSRTGPSAGSPAAAAVLARLGREGVRGATPAQWYGIAGPSSRAPRVDLSDPAAHLRISPSKIEQVEACALDWYVSRIAPEPSRAGASLGTLVHSVADLASATNAWGLDELLEATLARWDEVSIDAPWRDRAERTKARALLLALAQYQRDRVAAGANVAVSEAEFRVELGSDQSMPFAATVELSGMVDRLELSAEGARIVDLKTGKNGIVSESRVGENAQLLAYQFAYRGGGFGDITAPLDGASIVGLAGANTRVDYVHRLQPAMTAEGQAAFGARLADVATIMAASEFVADPVAHCTDDHSFGQCRIHTIDGASA